MTKGIPNGRPEIFSDATSVTFAPIHVLLPIPALARKILTHDQMIGCIGLLLFVPPKSKTVCG